MEFNRLLSSVSFYGESSNIQEHLNNIKKEITKINVKKYQRYNEKDLDKLIKILNEQS